MLRLRASIRQALVWCHKRAFAVGSAIRGLLSSLATSRTLSKAITLIGVQRCHVAQPLLIQDSFGGCDHCCCLRCPHYKGLRCLNGIALILYSTRCVPPAVTHRHKNTFYLTIRIDNMYNIHRKAVNMVSFVWMRFRKNASAPTVSNTLDLSPYCLWQRKSVHLFILLGKK